MNALAKRIGLRTTAAIDCNRCGLRQEVRVPESANVGDGPAHFAAGYFSGEGWRVIEDLGTTARFPLCPDCILPFDMRGYRIVPPNEDEKSHV